MRALSEYILVERFLVMLEVTTPFYPYTFLLAYYYDGMPHWRVDSRQEGTG